MSAAVQVAEYEVEPLECPECETELGFDTELGWPARCPGCDIKVLAPLPGPQTTAFASEADVILMGGGVFGGKSWWAGLETRKIFGVSNATILVLRQERKQLIGAGSLFDKFEAIYEEEIRDRTALTRQSNTYLDIRFPCYNTIIEFDGFQDNAFYKFEGNEYSLIIYDEAHQLSWKKFNLIRQRNRSPDGCNLKPRMLLTCNPPKPGDPGYWLRDFIDWYLDDEGYPIPERMGVLRYFTVQNNKVLWVSSDWVDQDGEPPKSFTFIQSLAKDNPVGLSRNPGYLSDLRAQTEVEQLRKLRGCWDARDGDLLFAEGIVRYFDREDVPSGWLDTLNFGRYWDQGMIGDDVEQRSDHCPTASSKGALAFCPTCSGTRWIASDLACPLCNREARVSKELAREMGPRRGLWIVDVVEQFGKASEIEALHKRKADADGKRVPIGIEREKGSAGVGNINNYKSNVLHGYIVVDDRPTGKKVVRAEPLQVLAELGLLFFLRDSSWNHLAASAIGSFTPQGTGDHVDVIDSMSGLHKMLVEYEWPPSFSWSL